MIEITVRPEGLGVNQKITSPSVYLDHWAFMDISQSDIWKDRFVKALLNRRGTLVLSWWNIVEFSTLSSEEQRNKADAFLNELGLNIFWIEIDYFTVGERELENAPAFLNPHSDLELLRFFVINRFKTTIPQTLVNPAKIFKEIYDAPTIRSKYDSLADDMIRCLSQMRQKLKPNSRSRSNFLKPLKNHLHRRYTQIISRKLFWLLLNSSTAKLNRNNAIDLAHASVPSSYCDYVLLDGQWAVMVNRVREELGKCDIGIPVAKAFSKRSNGVEIFLKELEGIPN